MGASSRRIYSNEYTLPCGVLCGSFLFRQRQFLESNGCCDAFGSLGVIMSKRIRKVLSIVSMAFACAILVMTCVVLVTYFWWDTALGQWSTGYVEYERMVHGKLVKASFEASYSVTTMVLWKPEDKHFQNIQYDYGSMSWHDLYTEYCEKGKPCVYETCDSVSKPIGFLLMGVIVPQVLLLWATIQRCTVYGDINCQKIWAFLLVFISGGCLVSVLSLFWTCADGLANGSSVEGMPNRKDKATFSNLSYSLPYYLLACAAGLNLLLGVLQMMLPAPYRNQDLKFETLEEYMEAGEAQPLPPKGSRKEVSLFPKGAVLTTNAKSAKQPDTEESDATDDEESPVSTPPMPLMRSSAPTEVVLECCQRKATFAENPTEERLFFVDEDMTPPMSFSSTHHDEKSRKVSPRGSRSLRSIPRRSGDFTEVTSRAHNRRYDEMSFARDYSSPHARYDDVYASPRSLYGGRRGFSRAETVHFYSDSARSMTPAPGGRSITHFAGRSTTPSGGRHLTMQGRSMTYAGRSVTPAERRMTPAGRTMTSAERSMALAGRSITPAGRSVAPVGRSMALAGRSITPAGRRPTPFGQSATIPSYHERGGEVRSDDERVGGSRVDYGYTGDRRRYNISAQMRQDKGAQMDKVPLSMTPNTSVHSSNNHAPRLSGSTNHPHSQTVTQTYISPRTSANNMAVDSLETAPSQAGGTSHTERPPSVFRRGDSIVSSKDDRSDSQLTGHVQRNTGSSQKLSLRSSGQGCVFESGSAINAPSQCSTSRGSQDTVQSSDTACDTSHSSKEAPTLMRQRAVRTPSVVPVREESGGSLCDPKQPNVSRAKKWSS